MTMQFPFAEAIARWCIMLAAVVLLLRSGYWLASESGAAVWVRIFAAFIVFGLIGGGVVGLLHLNKVVHSGAEGKAPPPQDASEDTPDIDEAEPAGGAPRSESQESEPSWVTCGRLRLRVDSANDGHGLRVSSRLNEPTELKDIIWRLEDLQVWSAEFKTYVATSQRVTPKDLFSTSISPDKPCVNTIASSPEQRNRDFTIGDEKRSTSGRWAASLSIIIRKPRERISSARIEFNWTPEDGLSPYAITPLNTEDAQQRI